MAEYCTTTIIIDGPGSDRAALRAALEESACGKLAFSLRVIAPEIWIGDDFLIESGIKTSDDSLHLRLCMIHRMECLELAAVLARRYPRLRLKAWFVSEGIFAESGAAAYESSQQRYLAYFPHRFTAVFSSEVSSSESDATVLFYRRTPQRNLAAADFLEDRMQLFLDQPTGLTEWRRSKGDDDSIFYSLPNGDVNGHVAVSVYLKAHLAVVLNNIDSCGGYQSMSRFPLAELLSSYPSLEPEIERLYQDAAVVQA